MEIGYLHFDVSQDWESGPCRYGRLLASAVRSSPGQTIKEAKIVCGQKKTARRASLKKAVSLFEKVKIIHINYGWQLYNLGVFFNLDLAWFLVQLRVPLVVSVHDGAMIANSSRWLQVLEQWRTIVKSEKTALRPKLQECVRFFIAAISRRLFLFFLSWRGRAFIVCTTQEADSLGSIFPRKKIQIIPHFIEQLKKLPPAEAARKKLKLEGFQIVTVLGFVFARKGHLIALEALSRLPPSIVLLFGGGAPAGGEDYLCEIMRTAKNLGVAGRVILTGHLKDEEQNTCLAATHLALCPFSSLSASGTLSTWLAADKPILATDLPQIQNYNKIAPGAIKVFSPYTGEALAAAILDTLLSPDQGKGPRQALRQQRSFSIIAEKHMALYTRVADKVG